MTPNRHRSQRRLRRISGWRESPAAWLSSWSFDMRKRCLTLLVACIAGILICTVLAGKILPRRNQSSISVAFSGFTNNAAGAELAQFTFSNGSSRHIGFAAANVQIRQANGWPQTWTLTNGPAYDVGPGMTQRFAVPLLDVEGAVWRVPVIYDRVGTKLDSLVYQARSIVGWPHVSRPSSTNTAEMIGLSNETVQRKGASRSAGDSNLTSSAADSHRSPFRYMGRRKDN
jgi:hypothetical protein